MDDAAFVRLRDQARAGDPEALGRLLQAFEPEVRLMVRVRLPRALRGQLDSGDLIQSLFRSLLTAPEGRATGFEDAGRFRGYLAGMVRLKVLEQYRHRTRRKYDLKREEGLYVRRGDRDEPRPLSAAGPSPSQVALAAEQLDRLCAGGDDRLVAIVGLRREGLTFDQIAERLGVSDRTVRRELEALRARLEREDRA